MRRISIIMAGLITVYAAVAIAWSHREALTSGTIGNFIEQKIVAAKYDAEREALERKYEGKFAAAPLSGCADFGSGRQPQLCLERVSAASVPFGSPIELRLRWRNLGAGQRIRVRVTSAAPVGRRYLYSGPNGAITSETFGGTASGDQRIVWDGKSIYCAPADAPMMCDAGDVGRFQIEALAFSGDDPFWPSWRPTHPVPTRFVLRSDTPQLEFTGLPRPIGRGRSLSSFNADQAFRDALPSDLAGSDFLSWKVVDQSPPVYETFASYCSDYQVPEPLEGRLTLCFPKSARDRYGLKLRAGDISVHGDVRMAAGVIPAKDAKSIANRAAASFLRGKVVFDHYPTDAELKRFGPQPRDRKDWYTEEQEAPQKAWGQRIVYLQQDQTMAHYLGGRQWLVSVDQVARDLTQGLRSDFITYYYRIGSDRRPCLVARWNRTQKTGSPPREELAASLACL